MAVLIHRLTFAPTVGLFAALLAGSVSLGGCNGSGVTCDQGDGAVAQARALPQPVLAALYNEAEAFSRTGENRFRRGKPVVTPLPGMDSSDLRFQAFGRRDARIRLRHCFDHGVTLWLMDLGKADGRVELHWGEGPTAGNQVLWHKPAAAMSP